MTVRRLKEYLKDVEDHLIVVLSRDAEGNGYCELGQICDNNVFHESEIGLRKLTPELKQQGYTEDDVKTEGKAALVLWPNC